ncbi:MAG: hypothetical protein EOS21_32315 [Mesorhizobium sp.]|nr:MAG: hypothetical protein EOS21_32315 [Mesorhizobium sp.]
MARHITVQRRALRLPPKEPTGGRSFGGTGLGYAKRLEKAKLCWPRIGHHRVQLNHAQLMALVDGMDWKRVRTVAVRRPQSVG